MSLTAERLRELLHYNPETGEWTRMAIRKGYRVGTPAGRLSNRSGYKLVGVDMKTYLSHRLAWLYMTGEWPKAQIDHINSDRADNRWCNLREADAAQNGHNRSFQKNNVHKIKGIAKSQDHWRSKPFSARICVRGQRIYLGRFATKEEAHAAYAAAAKEHHGLFARTE